MTPYDPLVSWYRNVRTVGNSAKTSMPLSRAINHIRSRPDIRSLITAIRELDTTAEDYEARAGALKLKLPGITFAADFAHERKLDAVWTHTGLMPIDVDLPEAESLALRGRLQQWPHTVAAWASARNKLHAVIRIEPRPSDKQEHRWAALAVAEAMEEAFGTSGLATDPSAKDVTRILFASHDPTAYLNLDATPLTVPLTPPTKQDNPAPAPASRSNVSESDLRDLGPRIGAYLPPKLIAIASATANRHHQIYDATHAAAGMIDADSPDAGRWADNAQRLIRQAAIASGYEDKVGEAELTRLLSQSWEQGAQSPLASRRKAATRPGGGPRHAPPPDHDDPPDDANAMYVEHLRTDEHSLRHVLGTLGYEVRLNNRSQVIEWKHNTQDRIWMPTDDYRESFILEEIARSFTSLSPQTNKPRPLRFGDTSWRRSLNAILHKERTDPFIDWLEALPKWDTEVRLPMRLHEMLAAENDELSQWASQHTLLLAIERAYHPGSFGHEVPVLLGPQGIGKDTYYRSLFPPDLSADWVSDRLQFGVDPGRQVEAMLGPVIVVASEMPGLSRSEVEHVKVFIQRQRDDFRLAYRRNAQPLPRRVAIAGTANELNLPNDPSGERRFVPIPVGLNVHDEDIPVWQEHVMRSNARDHEQLWAEALHRYHSRQHSSLPSSLKLTQRQRSAAYRARDELIENAVFQALINLASTSAGFPDPEEPDLLVFTTHDILKHSPTDVRSQPIITSDKDGRVKKALLNLKATQSKTQKNIRRDGKRTRAFTWSIPLATLEEYTYDETEMPNPTGWTQQ